MKLTVNASGVIRNETRTMGAERREPEDGGEQHCSADDKHEEASGGEGTADPSSASPSGSGGVGP